MNRKRLRELVYQKYDGHCAYCGRKLAMKDMQVDHIVSRYNAGTDDLDNLNPSCRMCNFRKQTFTISQFRKEITRQADTAMKTFANRMSVAYGLINFTPHKVEFYFEKRDNNIADNGDNLSKSELRSIQKGLEDIENGRTYKMQEGESLTDFLNRILEEKYDS